MRAAIDDSELVTRRDLREFELRLDPRFEAIKVNDVVTKDHLDYKLAEVKADLIKWVVGLALVQSGLLVGILLKLA